MLYSYVEITIRLVNAVKASCILYQVVSGVKFLMDYSFNGVFFPPYIIQFVLPIPSGNGQDLCVCLFLSRLCNTLKAHKQVLGWAPLIGTLHIKS